MYAEVDGASEEPAAAAAAAADVYHDYQASLEETWPVLAPYLATPESHLVGYVLGWSFVNFHRESHANRCEFFYFVRSKTHDAFLRQACVALGFPVRTVPSATSGAGSAPQQRFAGLMVTLPPPLAAVAFHEGATFFGIPFVRGYVDNIRVRLDRGPALELGFSTPHDALVVAHVLGETFFLPDPDGGGAAPRPFRATLTGPGPVARFFEVLYSAGVQAMLAAPSVPFPARAVPAMGHARLAEMAAARQRSGGSSQAAIRFVVCEPVAAPDASPSPAFKSGDIVLPLTRACPDETLGKQTRIAWFETGVRFTSVPADLALDIVVAQPDLPVLVIGSVIFDPIAGGSTTAKVALMSKDDAFDWAAFGASLPISQGIKVSARKRVPLIWG